jgi:hypothetical protein
MRKLIAILLAVALVLTCSVAFAGPMNRFNQDQKVKLWTVTYVRNGTSQAATGNQITFCNTNKIYPGVNRILGFSITATAGFGEGFVGLYDADAIADINVSTSAGSPTALEVEAELTGFSANSPYVEVWFPYPLELNEGLAVIQGANTSVTVFYEDYRR